MCSDCTYHLLKTSSGGDVTRMDHPVEMTGRLLDLFAHVIITLQVEDVRD